MATKAEKLQRHANGPGDQAFRVTLDANKPGTSIRIFNGYVIL
ncbi:hypothetical protein [Aureitalea sp. L0-47]|nr:hypothetical protein [Aureitalea sp. L0-47]